MQGGTCCEIPSCVAEQATSDWWWCNHPRLWRRWGYQKVLMWIVRGSLRNELNFLHLDLCFPIGGMANFKMPWCEKMWKNFLKFLNVEVSSALIVGSLSQPPPLVIGSGWSHYLRYLTRRWSWEFTVIHGTGCCTQWREHPRTWRSFTKGLIILNQI